MLTNVEATLMQGRVHGQGIKHRLIQNWREGRLMLGTIVIFIILYMVVAFFLVNRGMEFVHRLPLIGPVLTERMLFLLFFFFFVMLILSNAAITGIGLFRRQETGWMLSLPVPHASVVLWKTVEGMLLSSWGLMLLSAPILVGFGKTFEAGPAFYLVSVPAILCLIAVASNVSTWLLLLLIRFYRPWWLKVAVVALVILMGMIFFTLRDSRSVKLVSGDVATNANQILRHTQLFVHPLLPSSWVAETVIAAGRSLWSRVWFYNLMLVSYASVAWIFTAWMSKLIFYPTWNRSWCRSQQQQGKKEAKLNSRGREQGLFSWLAPRLGIGRATRALLAKDGYTFIREPMQWGQCALIFGLLLLYTSNLRHLGYNYREPVWSAVISYLNLTVCCLAMSTLTTRFVFPQFSMEGQRLWILGLAPFSLSKVLRQKLAMNLVAATPLTTILVAVSSYSLDLPLHRALFFIAMIVLLTVGLNTLSLSLGVLLPNFKEANSAKIVSGFGGTLCLVLSFFYIVLGVAIAIYPTYRDRTTSPTPTLLMYYQWELTALLFVGILTLVVAGVPYFFALKRTKILANLGNL